MTISAQDRRAASLLGALVADAAGLGLHWIYDVGRIAEIAENRSGNVVFTPIERANYDGVPSYFAHGLRRDGQLSQYGENLWLAVRSMIKTNGVFDRASFQDDFVSTFGAGGSYQGYIDRPTRGALDNIANGQADPSGIDDDQMPAVSRIPSLLAAAETRPAPEDLTALIGVTNVNDDAFAYGRVHADLLWRVLGGEALGAALLGAAQATTDHIGATLVAALSDPENDSVAYGEVTQRACHLPMGMPLSFHIMARASSFRDAIERNIRAGGDSAGRAIIIGSVMGAHLGSEAIPLAWTLSLDDAPAIWAACRKLVGELDA